MKFLRLGFVAALACALAGQALAATPAVKIEPAARAAGMKEAPAAVESAGVDCAISDAYLKGNGEIKVNGKTVKSSVYEVACGPSVGYLLIAAPGTDAQAYDCMAMKEAADKAIAAKQKPSTSCDLPGNADPKQGLIPILAKAGATCTQVTAARYMGSSASDKISIFEVACPGTSGYILTQPQKGSTRPLMATECVKSALIGLNCTLTPPEAQAQSIIKLSEGAKRPACMPNRARWVVTDTATGSDYWEVGCGDGKTGYMFQTDKSGSFKTAIECVLATRIAGGCTLSSADAGQTADAPMYTKLAKAAGYDCDVSKYQSYGAETGGQREIVELACSNHPDGAFAIVPTGNGQTGEYFNCLRAMDRGFACRLSPIEATYAKISSQIAARGKTTCTVNGGRGIGKIASGVEFVEVTCAGAPNLVLGYSRLPQETLVSALPCAQAEINDACKLPPSK
jgi:hypothetical protein